MLLVSSSLKAIAIKKVNSGGDNQCETKKKKITNVNMKKTILQTEWKRNDNFMLVCLPNLVTFIESPFVKINRGMYVVEIVHSISIKIAEFDGYLWAILWLFVTKFSFFLLLSESNTLRNRRYKGRSDTDYLNWWKLYHTTKECIEFNIKPTINSFDSSI